MMNHIAEVKLGLARHADAADLIEANRQSRHYHHPFAAPFIDQEGFDSWFSQMLTGASRGLVARHASSGGIIGVFTLSQIALGNFRSAYLGYYGMVAFAGQGLMRQALDLVLDHAFTEIGLNRVEANIQPDNHRSVALVERCGFEKEGFSPRYLKIGGEWRDHLRYARLAPIPERG
ncbi:GNAT family N-acetyltransferase [Allorhizobium sp. BGMRC 0089]|uniref:GNAT family N-acetyltransferase n=1 Tax=Allorhizobium sonneratiae TaxID=2934936 RepID=UPI002033E248|nr:GNAT family protein [Allorhizobium sonneratiae]MCM2291849.1 GNAT family N-acetyltransferase [Allorhizobium sonneratiae]